MIIYIIMVHDLSLNINKYISFNFITVNQLLQAVSSITNYLFTWKKVRNNCLFKRRLKKLLI